MIRYLGVLVCLFFVCGCGAKTTVILLPQEDGTVGSVVVKNQSSSTVLDKPYSYTKVSDDTSSFPVEFIDRDEVTDQYQHLLDAEPAKPVHFLLYFKHDSTKPTQASLALIPDILQSAKEREPSEITVIGHSDSLGPKEYNIRLSLKRAKAVEKILKEMDTNLKHIYVQSYGESDPLVVSGDNVSEARNRRVEIMIK